MCRVVSGPRSGGIPEIRIHGELRAKLGSRFWGCPTPMPLPSVKPMAGI
jgi:hypothetical protein